MNYDPNRPYDPNDAFDPRNQPQWQKGYHGNVREPFDGLFTQSIFWFSVLYAVLVAIALGIVYLIGGWDLLTKVWT